MVENNENPTGDEKLVVPKEEFDTLKAQNEKLAKDLEDVRMEVLTPEYSAYLDSLNAPKDKKDDKVQEPTDDFEKLTKKQLFELAKKAAVDEIRGENTKRENETKAQSDARSKREIQTFASTHTDFETYRPTMYGLSLDPKHADLSLEQLYNAAKDHIKRIAGGPTEEEKKRQEKIRSEKPGNDNQSFEKLKKMNNTQIGQAALDEVKAKLGPIPSI